jgi:rsbT antagonist protein RsbS
MGRCCYGALAAQVLFCEGEASLKIPILQQKDILLTAIQEEIADEEEAMVFQREVLDKAAKTRAAGMVIDISALEIVDTFMARVLNDTAEAVQLLGLEVVVCGMQPVVAVTLVEMGRRLLGVRTCIDLDHALEILYLALIGWYLRESSSKFRARARAPAPARNILVI